MNHGIILAGGSGSRLWPASRRAHPKQFLPLVKRGQESLLAATARRMRPVFDARMSVITAADQARAVNNALPNFPASAIIAEPVQRNTAAAIGVAAAYCSAKDPEAIVGVIPADQVVTDEAEFANVCQAALLVAKHSDTIVTIGIVPNQPHTGFGYIERGKARSDGAYEVLRFVEKPTPEKAAEYLASGTYLWNAGMFFAPANRLLSEIARHLPETGAALDEIAQSLATQDIDAARAHTERLYPNLPAISIDYAVMEKAHGILCVPGDFGWNDVGSWSSLAEYVPPDPNGNAVIGEAITRDATNNVIYTDDGLVAVIGVDNLAIVRSGDAILVVPRERSQDVRDIVSDLKQKQETKYL